MKPMLAEDWVESKLRFPLEIEPKIDGVRALTITGKLTGRSLKPFGNRYTSQFFGHSAFYGLDGEMAAESCTHPDLCRLTTSALNTYTGEPLLTWWLFDYVTPVNSRYGYADRYDLLQAQIELLQSHPDRDVVLRAQRLRLVPKKRVHDLDEVLHWEQVWLDEGYEGIIARSPTGAYKFGRSTPDEGGLLRNKRFIEEEAVVDCITEGQHNANTATTGLLGQTERSTHQANMIPNGMVGSLECTDVKTGKLITVSAGSMPHDDRVKFFQSPALIIGQTVIYKHFPKGVKDKPRFPTFKCIRMREDKV
jgi:DNA ligase-1